MFEPSAARSTRGTGPGGGADVVCHVALQLLARATVRHETSIVMQASAGGVVFGEGDISDVVAGLDGSGGRG